ncbi:hypothetical protein bas02_0072 [Veterinaerplatzvirus Jeanpiccard]|uniref:Uncharacterized protein n=1 Tax=Escherichia phage JeanPiccard TaxID=2851955 RepID=A0AAE7VUT8_9CAUD|nr:hypothetical protein bas02_0072 [Escherichia phage JeanPiccard]
MATWVLVIMIYNAGVESIEMDSKQTCIEAVEIIMDNKVSSQTKAVCIRKKE